MAHSPKKTEPTYLYGFHAVSAALVNPRRKFNNVLISLPPEHPNRLALEELIEDMDVPPRVSETVRGHLDKLVGKDAVHQGIVASVKPLPNHDVREFLLHERSDMPSIAILDQVTDPHNVGAILRSAAAFGIGALITTNRHAPEESGLIGRISSGGLEVVPWLRVRNLGQACETLLELGYELNGLAGEATKNLSRTLFTPDAPQAFVFGSEGEGLRAKTRELCTRLVKLPTVPPVLDLNVSNAAAVTFFASLQD